MRVLAFVHLMLGTSGGGERDKKHEMICDRFLPKNASFEEQMKYLRDQHEKEVRLDLWEEKEEEDDDLYMGLGLSKSEIFRLKRERKISIASRKEFIDKFPILNPSPPNKVEKKLKKKTNKWD